MGRKKGWFGYVKRLFVSESRPKSGEKPKKWGWFFGRFKFRQRPALEAPREALSEVVTEEQRKHALAVAIATAAAAEAAVAAANAAAEVVRLTSIPYERKNQYLAAIKIQSAYRAHLAKKALNALIGLVKLQAVIRGELVRRKVVKTMESMSGISKAESQVHKKTPFDYLTHGGKRHGLSQKDGSKSKELQPQRSIHKRWDLSLVCKEEREAMPLQKQEAIREHMKQYPFSQREMRNDRSLQESMKHKENRSSMRSDKLLEAHSQEGNEKLKPLSRSNTTTVDISNLPRLKQRAACKQQRIDELNTIFSQPRRSLCHVKQRSIGDDGSLPESPVFPAYMAATKSTKAKSRSLSTPKQRLRLWDTYSGELSPSKRKLSSWSSFSGEITKSSKRNSISQHMPFYHGTLI